MTIQVKNDPKTIHIYNSTSKNNLYIKIGEKGTIRKIMYSTTSDSKGAYKLLILLMSEVQQTNTDLKMF
jgi:hypothetical protein